jgi:RHS repeat-associated protein
MPATATYNPLTSQNLAYVIRADTRDTRRFADAPRPSPPLKGLRETRAATVSYRASVPAGHGGRGVAPFYRALAPHGAGLPSGIEGRRSDVPQPTANYSLLTANSSFTFSAKERDSETGLSYFGSRYYSSDLSIWLSVDPMSDKYASLSPYVYCADNPVRCVDPNGEEIDDIYINTETKQVSVIKTNDNFDRIIVDGVYSGNREKGTEVSERAQQGYSSEDDQKNGIYAYCGNRDANGKSNYGEDLMKQFVSTKKRFIQSLEYQINKNEEMIRQGIPYSTQYLNRLEKDNERYNAILNEIR